MPGQITLDPRYYPADFNVVVEILAIPSTGTFLIPVLYADRPLLIDSVAIVRQINNAPTGNVTFKLKQTVGALAPTFGTTTEDIGSFAQLTTGSTAAAIMPLTFTLTGASPNNNFVPTGSTVWLQASAAYGAAVNLVIQIRYRSQM